MIRHIRTVGGDLDRRYNAGQRGWNKTGGTHSTPLCGAEPTIDDLSKKAARHIIATCATLKPDWVAEICPACRERLERVP